MTDLEVTDDYGPVAMARVVDNVGGLEPVRINILFPDDCHVMTP